MQFIIYYNFNMKIFFQIELLGFLRKGW
jgi:hypothetical protein